LRFVTARRVGWGIADQGLSSLTNFGVGVLVARSVSPEDFGAFSLAFAAYIIALVIGRGLVGEPLVVRSSRVPLAQWREAAAASTGFVIALSALISAVVLVGALVARGRVGEAFVALALVLPGLLLQDAWRFAFVANGQPRLAFLSDLIWLAVLVPGLLALDAWGVTSLAGPVLIWGGSALLAAFMATSLARTWPAIGKARSWWRRNLDLGPRFTIEGVISVAAAQATLYVLGGVAGLSAAGAFRGAQLLLGPIQMLIMGISMVGVPEGVRILHSRGPRGLPRPATLVSLALAAGAVLWGLLLTLLPQDVGRQILGESWDGAQMLVLPMAIGFAGVMIGLGPGVGIRALADARRSLAARSIHAAAELTGGVVGAIAGGPLGAAIGVALGSWAGAGAMWIAFMASVREHEHAASPPGTGAAPQTTPP
jgi:O-antigen/teichoic acid export membrane protein